MNQAKAELGPNNISLKMVNLLIMASTLVDDDSVI